MQFMTRKNITILVSIASVFGLIIIGLVFYNTQTAPIRVAPENAKIRIDGKEVVNNSRQWIKWSDHTVEISADGFETLTEKLSEQGAQQDDYLFCLNPISDRAKATLSSKKNTAICDGVGGRYQKVLAKKAYDNNPILNDIPFNEGLFSIGQGLSQKENKTKDDFGIYVHYYNDESLADAKKWISDRADITKLEVIYIKDYHDTRVAGELKTADYKALESNFPIVKYLPYKDPYYLIGYRSTNSKDLRLVIYTSSPRYRYAALQQLAVLGYNQTDYDIEFVDYTNPLGKDS